MRKRKKISETNWICQVVFYSTVFDQIFANEFDYFDPYIRREIVRPKTFEEDKERMKNKGQRSILRIKTILRQSCLMNLFGRIQFQNAIRLLDIWRLHFWFISSLFWGNLPCNWTALTMRISNFFTGLIAEGEDGSNGDGDEGRGSTDRMIELSYWVLIGTGGEMTGGVIILG